MRDIDRFRQLYKWFIKNLPKKFNIQFGEAEKSILGDYNNIEQRGFVMAAYFTYILRFGEKIRNGIEKIIEKALQFKDDFLRNAKEAE